MIRRPPRSTLFPYRRSSDLNRVENSASSDRPGGASAFRPASSTTRGTVSTRPAGSDRKSTRLNSSHLLISYDVFCLKKKKVHLQSNQVESAVVAQLKPESDR